MSDATQLYSVTVGGHTHDTTLKDIVAIWHEKNAGNGPMGKYDMIYVMHACEDLICIPAHNCTSWVTDAELNRQREPE